MSFYAYDTANYVYAFRRTPKNQGQEIIRFLALFSLFSYDIAAMKFQRKETNE